MKRSSYLTLATLVASLALLTSACSQQSSGTSGGADSAATSAAGQQGAMGTSGGYGANGSGRRSGGQMMGKILLTLGLTDAQKSQIRQIRKTMLAKNKAIPQTDPNRRDEIRANMQSMATQIDAVLTPQQRDTFHAQLKAMRARFQQQEGQVQQPSQQSSP